MDPEILLVLEIGLILTLGVLGSDGLKKLNIPIILGFILVGIIAGMIFRPLGLFQEHYASITNVIVAVALGFIGFHLGSEINWNTLKSQSSKVFVILLFEAFITFFLVTFIVLVITQEFYLALLFGALASATAPAGTAAVFWEFDCKGPLTSTTMIILALDDVFVLIMHQFIWEVKALIYSTYFSLCC
jgi:NhaP-type Na+/H+ or K+/H+ antiporter